MTFGPWEEASRAGESPFDSKASFSTESTAAPNKT